MTRANKLISYTIADWETAAKNRTDIIFVKFNLVNGKVFNATGSALANNKQYTIVWDSSGRAYHNKNRVRQYDIKL